MTRFQGTSGRLITGGRLRKAKEKKKRELGSASAETQIADERKKVVRTHGGKTRLKLFRHNKVTVMNTSTGKASFADIKDVATNPASREYSRRRIITKGAILDTSVGKARVTNRPGNEGFINAVLIEE